MHLTRVYDALLAADNVLVQTKLNDSWYGILVLAFMCGVMIYLGVENFARSNNNFSKVFGIVMCVFVFIICSFEHSIADMFYFLLADSYTLVLLPMGAVVPIIAVLYPTWQKNVTCHVI